MSRSLVLKTAQKWCCLCQNVEKRSHRWWRQFALNINISHAPYCLQQPTFRHQICRMFTHARCRRFSVGLCPLTGCYVFFVVIRHTLLSSWSSLLQLLAGVRSHFSVFQPCAPRSLWNNSAPAFPTLFAQGFELVTLCGLTAVDPPSHWINVWGHFRFASNSVCLHDSSALTWYTLTHATTHTHRHTECICSHSIKVGNCWKDTDI